MYNDGSRNTFIVGVVSLIFGDGSYCMTTPGAIVDVEYYRNEIQQAQRDLQRGLHDVDGINTLP